jgi:hypothetical protein
VIFEATTTLLSIVIPLLTSLPILSINVTFSIFELVFERWSKLSSFVLFIKTEFVRVKAAVIKSLFDPYIPADTYAKLLVNWH